VVFGSAFDVDPLLGGTSMPGFTEWSAFYGSYRVYESQADVQVSVYAANSPPLTVILIPLNLDPGASVATPTVVSWVGNPYARKQLLANSGSKAVRLRSTMSTEKIYGTTMIWFDDNFSADVTGSPANNWYWALGLLAPAVLASTESIAVEMTIKVRLELYNRLSLLA